MRAAETSERRSNHNAKKTSASGGDSHGTGCGGRIPNRAHMHSPAGCAEEPLHQKRNRDTQNEQRADCQSRFDLGKRTPSAQRNSRKLGCARLNEWLAEIERNSAAENENCDACGDVIHFRSQHEQGMEHSENSSGEACRTGADPGIARLIGNRIAAHRAHKQDTLQSEIDLAALLRKTFAQTDQQEGSAASNRPCKDANQYAPPANRVGSHVASSLKNLIFP